MKPLLCTPAMTSHISAAIAPIERDIPCHCTVSHQSRWRIQLAWVFCAALIAPLISSNAAAGDDKVHGKPATATVTTNKVQEQCLPDGMAYLRARLNGAINAELNWERSRLQCEGSARPDERGIRLRFTQLDGSGAPLVLLFGISGLHEGESGKALPVNVTIIREGSGEFYGTQGDNKCTIDELHQERLSAAPRRERTWRVIARGFCTQPARALNGTGSVLISRFDFAGRVDYGDDVEAPPPPAMSAPKASIT